MKVIEDYRYYYLGTIHHSLVPLQQFPLHKLMSTISKQFLKYNISILAFRYTYMHIYMSFAIGIKFWVVGVSL